MANKISKVSLRYFIKFYQTREKGAERCEESWWHENPSKFEWNCRIRCFPYLVENDVENVILGIFKGFNRQVQQLRYRKSSLNPFEVEREKKRKKFPSTLSRNLLFQQTELFLPYVYDCTFTVKVAVKRKKRVACISNSSHVSCLSYSRCTVTLHRPCFSDLGKGQFFIVHSCPSMLKNFYV